jgi:hypothetical protein
MNHTFHGVNFFRLPNIGVIMIKMEYETFIRRAFGVKLNGGKIIGRWEDPACLANTDKYEDRYISKVKAAVIYSMEIFRIDIVNNEKVDNDAEDGRLDSYSDKVMAAPDLPAISAIIQDFETSVLDVYYDTTDGVMCLIF